MNRNARNYALSMLLLALGTVAAADNCPAQRTDNGTVPGKCPGCREAQSVPVLSKVPYLQKLFKSTPACPEAANCTGCEAAQAKGCNQPASCCQEAASCPSCPASDRNAEIERRLRLPVSTDFGDMPLADVLDELADARRLNIVPNKSALNEAGVDLQTPITLKVTDIPLGKALTMLLEQVHLTYVVQDSVLVITTPAKARGKLTMRTYQVEDLIFLVSLSRPGAPGKCEQDAAQLLTKIIQRGIAPDTWGEMGGCGTIDYYPLGSSLVVNQTADVHEQIAELLTALRRGREDKVQPPMPVPTVAVPVGPMPQAWTPFGAFPPPPAPFMPTAVAVGPVPPRAPGFAAPPAAPVWPVAVTESSGTESKQYVIEMKWFERQPGKEAVVVQGPKVCTTEGVVAHVVTASEQGNVRRSMEACVKSLKAGRVSLQVKAQLHHREDGKKHRSLVLNKTVEATQKVKLDKRVKLPLESGEDADSWLEVTVSTVAPTVPAKTQAAYDGPCAVPFCPYEPQISSGQFLEAIPAPGPVYIPSAAHPTPVPCVTEFRPFGFVNDCAGTGVVVRELLPPPRIAQCPTSTFAVDDAEECEVTESVNSCVAATKVRVHREDGRPQLEIQGAHDLCMTCANALVVKMPDGKPLKLSAGSTQVQLMGPSLEACADRLSIDAKGCVVLEGHARLRCDQNAIAADRISFRPSNGSVEFRVEGKK